MIRNLTGPELVERFCPKPTLPFRLPPWSMEIHEVEVGEHVLFHDLLGAHPQCAVFTVVEDSVTLVGSGGRLRAYVPPGLWESMREQLGKLRRSNP